MDLYCDEEACVEDNTYGHGKQNNFTGKSRAHCIRQAKKDGWMFHANGDVSCPECMKKRKLKSMGEL